MKNETYLLMDWGATRVKCALYNRASDKLSRIKDFKNLPNIAKIPGRYQISAVKLHKMFLNLCQKYWQIKKYDSIFLCSQMHGFILLDKHNHPLTNYITWQDEHSLEPEHTGHNAYSLVLQNIKNDYKKITGTRPNPSLPFFNIISYCRALKIKGEIKVMTLTDWFSLISNNTNNLAHDTLAAGLGFYDLRRKKISNRLLKLSKKYTGCDFICNDITGDFQKIAGYLNLKNNKIPIHVGIGDQQCALLGANNKIKKSLSINIGTGSQVSLIKKNIGKLNSIHDYRPYFNNNFLWTITHIPAGRVLNKYAEFLSEISDGRCNLWKEISFLSLRNLEKSEIIFDLNIFSSSFNYKNGGLIKGLEEKNLNKYSFIHSLFKSFLDQYITISASLTGSKWYNCNISGGIPGRYPIIVKYFRNKLKYAKKITITKKCDETLLGLKKITKNIIYIK